MNILEIKGLKKSFGTKHVIDGLDLAVPEHSVFGFIGPNGSGKTTTMKMVLGLLKQDAGTITVCGERVTYGETKTNRFVGYLPDVPEFYGYMRPVEYLRLCGRISGMSKTEIAERSEDLLKLVGLSDEKRKIAGFSRGMKQRLGIAQALLNEPKLLICDEPTSALDPVGRKEILDILSEVQGKTTVIFSTHILSDVERICDRIAVLNGGKIALSGTLAEIKAHHSFKGYTIEFASTDDINAYTAALQARDASATLSVEDLVMTIGLSGETTDAGQGHTLIQLLADRQITPVRFEITEPDLEDLFMEVVK